MAWSFEQQVRLQQERQIIDKYLKMFKPIWNNPTIPGSANVKLQMKTNDGNIYPVRLDIPIDLPNSVPRVYVEKYLIDFSRNNLANLGASAVMHTLAPLNGFIQICHYHPSRWTPNVTFYKVLMKARIWLEAYEGHLKTGNNLDYYLRHQ